MDVAVKRWVVLFTGFLQNEAGGLEKVQRRIHRDCGGPDTLILLKSWRDSPKDVARRIANWRDEESDPQIIVAGFSYGGWTANQLCKELQKFSLSVDSLLLCDPVGRFFGNLPTIFSMLNVFPVHVPGNVRTLYTWRQRFDYPRGARIVLDDKITHWTGGSEASCFYNHVPHVNMDDLPEFQRTLRRVACAREETKP